MSATRAALTCLSLCGLLGGCNDECSSYSAFTCKTADYNVMFYYPSNTEQHLGQVKGLSTNVDNRRAASRHLRTSLVTVIGDMFVA